MERKYGGIVWTNHALDRLRERNIRQGDAWAAWKRPDSSVYDKTKDVWVYQKNYGPETVEIVTKKNDRGEWIVLSVWSKRVRHEISPKKGKANWLMKLVNIFRRK